MSTQKTALITGITGQDGSYLAEFLLSKGYRVVGMVRRSSTINFERIKHIQDKIDIVQGDLIDLASLIDIMKAYQPDEVYNLAAQSFVPTSWRQPVLTGEVTALGVTRILDAIRMVKPDARFYQASSSEMFMALPKSMDTGLPSTTANPTACTPFLVFCSTMKARAVASNSSHAKSAMALHASSWGFPKSCAWATWKPAATGAMPATMCVPCG